MAITWSEELATGVALIDAQHQELFLRINKLLEACNQGRGRNEVGSVIKFLEVYVIAHFAEEEQHMINYHYPAYRDHKAQHTEFMENFAKLKGLIDSEGVGLTAVISTNHLVVEWLKNHIRKIDRALGEFLRARTVSVASARKDP
ncbi:MAG: hemerythrin family protein [Nitrospirae bacterium]|nr:hemerythrin family protein [Nitrospirota bacterium]